MDIKLKSRDESVLQIELFNFIFMAMIMREIAEVSAIMTKLKKSLKWKIL